MTPAPIPFLGIMRAVRWVLRRCLMPPTLVLLGAGAPAFAQSAGRESLDSYQVRPSTESDVPMLVLGFAADQAYQNAEALTQALKQVLERSVEWSVAPGDYSLEVLAAGLDCTERPDIPCLRRIAQKIERGQFVWGWLEEKDGKLQAHLSLWSNGRTSASTELSYPTSLANRFDLDLLRLSDTALSQLLGPLHYPVQVRARAPVGTLWVDDQSAGSLDSSGTITLHLTSGPHTLRLEVPGRTAITARLEVRLRGPTQVYLDPAVQPPRSERGPRRSHAATPTEDTPGSSRTAAIVTLGTGGALLVGGLLAAIRIQVLNNTSGYLAYRRGLAPNQDACQEATRGHIVQGAMRPSDVERFCNEASLLETLEFTMLGLGAGLTGLGLYLAFDTPSPPTTAKIHWPQLGFGTNSATAHWRVDF